MISIFISSTFMDMQVERDLLQKEVLPELRDYARQFGEEVQFIDLRWGVDLSKVNEEKATETILEVCFKNIEDSKPYFLGLLGERYGTLIELDKIPTPNFRNYVGKSLTEAEIEFGVFADRSQKSLFLFREPFEKGSIPSESKKLYQEDSQQEKIRRLKEKIKTTVPEQRVLSYRGSWKKDSLELENFSSVVTTALKALLQKDLKVEADLSVQERELNNMHFYMKQKARQFKARTNDLESVKKLLENRSLILIQGKAGSGKSTLLSALYETLKKKGEVVPIISDLTSESRTAENVLLQQIWALEKILGKESFTKVDKETTVEQQQDNLAFLISQLPKEKPLYILIDAIDQLETDDLRDSLGFLPRVLRKEDRIIISYLEDLKVNGKNRYGKANLAEFTLKSLKEEDSKEVLNSARAYRAIPEVVIEEILKKKHSDNPLYLSLLVNRLFLLDAPHFREIASHNQDKKDHTAEHLKKVIIDTPESLKEVSVVLAEEAGKNFGKKLSEEVFKTLSFSRRGFTVSALEQIIGKDFTLLDFELLSKYLDNLLVRQEDGRIDFSHRVVREGLRDYFNDQEKENYTKVFGFLRGLDDLDPIKLREFLYYCIKTENYEEIINYLMRLLKIDNKDILIQIAEEIKNLLLQEGSEWLLVILNRIAVNEFRLLFFIIDYLFGSFILSYKNLQILEKIYDFICEKLETLVLEKETPKLLIIFSESLFHLARIQSDLGKNELAKENYLKVIEIREELGEEHSTPSSKSFLAGTLNNLGRVQDVLGDKNSIEANYKRAVKIREELVEQLGTPKEKSELANSLNSLGVIQSDLGKLESAQKNYLRAIDIENELVEQFNMLDYKSGLANTLNNYGVLLNELGEIKKAQENYLRAVSLRNELVDHLGTPKAKMNLARSLNTLGNLQKDLGKYQSAQENYLKAIDLGEELLEFLGTTEAKTNLAITLDNLAGMQSELSDYKLAQESYERAKELREELLEVLGTTEAKSDLAHILIGLGMLHNDLGDYKSAQENYQKALELNEEVVKKIDTPDYKESLAISLNCMAILQKKLGEYKKAEKNYLRAIAIEEELAQQFGTPETKSNLAQVLNNLGMLQWNLGEKKVALENLQRSSDLEEELVEQLGMSKYKSSLALSLSNLGQVQDKLGNVEAALDNLLRAIELNKELVNNLGTFEAKSNLADTFDDMTVLQWRLNQREEAEMYCFNAVKLRKELMEALGTVITRDRLSKSLYNMGGILAAQKEYKASFKTYRLALELREGLEAPQGNSRLKRYLSSFLKSLEELGKKGWKKIKKFRQIFKRKRS